MKSRTYLFGPLIPLTLYLLLAVLLDTGDGNWDGVSYTQAAFAWNDAFPFLGDDHWALRHPLVLPMATSIWALGPSELALILPNLIYGVGLIVLSYAFCSAIFGSRAGFFVAVLVATSASLVLRPLEVEIRGAEVFFAALSLWVFLLTSNRAQPRMGGVWLAGVLAGFAWLCRESAAYLVPTLIFGAYVVAPHGHRLRSLLAAAGGFAVVLCCELIAYTVAAQDPFYRYKIDLGHGGDSAESGLAADLVRADFGDWLLEPFQRLLMADIQGVLALIVLMCVAYILRHRRDFEPLQAKALLFFGTAATLSFLFSGLLLSLEIPRYYPMLGYAGSVITGVVLSRWRPDTFMVWPLAFAVSMACLGLVLAEYRADYTKRFVDAGADLALRIEEPIGAHPRMARRIEVALRVKGVSAQSLHAEVFPATSAEISEGELVLHFENAQGIANAAWIPEASTVVPWKLSHRVLRWALPVGVLPERLSGPSEKRVTVFRIR